DDGLGGGAARRGPGVRHLEDLVERCRARVARQVLLEDVVRDAEIDGARCAAERVTRSLAKESRHVARDGCFDAPLGDRREERLLLELLVLAAIAIRTTRRGDPGGERSARPGRLPPAPP